MSLKNSLFTLIGVCVFLGELNAQNNLIDPSSWTVGTGVINGFTIYGLESENERIQYTDPHGNSSVVWMAKPEGGSSNSADGGYYSPYVNIDETKTYRYSVWMKKTGDATGYSYLGLSIKNASWAGSTLNLDSTTASNPYFWWGDLPTLDKWYLIVGYVHPNSYTGTALGGVFDPVTGEQVTTETVIDFKFGSGSAQTLNRGILFANNNNYTNRQYYWNPTIYEVNGLEPTVAEMLGSNPFCNGSSVDITDPVGTGTVTARAEYNSNEGMLKAFDNKKVSGDFSKWLDNSGIPSTSNPSWISIQLPSAKTVHSLLITSANDDYGRDPKDFRLLGSNGGNFIELGSWSNIDFTARFQTKSFSISQMGSYTNYRLEITKNDQSVFETQLAEIELLGCDSVSPTSVTVSPSSLSLSIGQSSTLTSTVSPSNADPSVTWSSSNVNVATVDTLGIVTGVGEGTANIIVTSVENNTITDQSVVTVTESDSSSNWIQNGNDIYFDSGNVGIGTDSPGIYALAVNGNIRSKELKVETANWPDYVFAEDYNLPTLEEVQKQIDMNGHLINIPSAKEIEVNGLELGEMNRLLLHKIEELTLYILQREKRIQVLEKKFKTDKN